MSNPSLVRKNTQWISGTSYAVGDIVWISANNIQYPIVCLVAHAAGTFATDVTSGYWQMATPTKNYAINGNFDYWQRGTSIVVNPGGTGRVMQADRFSVTDFFSAGQLTHARSTDIPAGLSHNRYSMSTTVASTVTVAVSTTNYALTGGTYKFEGLEISPLYNKDITISFWVKSSTAGTYAVALQAGLPTPDARYIAEYTINSANTWEKKIISLNINTSTGTFATDNTFGMSLQFPLAVNAASLLLGTTTNQWVSSSYALVTAASNRTEMLASGSVFKIAQLMINEGTVPAQFQRAGNNITEELVLCQRYFEKSYEIETPPGTVTYTGCELCVSPDVTNSMHRTMPYKVRKRVIGSIFLYNPVTGAQGTWRNDSAGTNIGVATTLNGERNLSVGLGGITAGHQVTGHWITDSDL